MLLRKYVTPELDRYIELCNFTEDELQYFKLKASGKNHVQIADTMNICYRQVTNLSQRVRAKMARV